jgi:catechol 2,3-dioxygenase-like lactoylglutathione lyase family enzyme
VIDVIEFLSCRPNLEVGDLAPAAAFLREVLGFEVEVDEPGMGLMLLRRDAVGLALVRSDRRAEFTAVPESGLPLPGTR